ncbi:MAG: hypothetical protein ACTHYB_07330 [Canibacter sp.]
MVSARRISTRRHGRHDRRPPRSSLTGPYVANPNSPTAQFEAYAMLTVRMLQAHEPELQSVNFEYVSMPRIRTQSNMPNFYAINRAKKSITLYRVPILRSKVLHVDDIDHRRMFIAHCVYQAVCEYLGSRPWGVDPAMFDHF